MAKTNWIGKKVAGRYEIEQFLGQGGMSAVYKANDPNLRRVVAVKLIHNHLSDNPEFVRRFEEEAAAVAQLRHPNILQVYDFNHDDGTYFIVFEFVPGETLDDRLKRLKEANRKMPINEAVKYTADIGEALSYAAARGLVHRDIKPANVMINVQGDAILMDFGIVKIMGGTQHTATGAVMGTARYMSPEQIKGQKVDERSDLYSLAVTLFHMLSGDAPYNADSVMTVMMMHVQDPIPNMHQLRADVPASLTAVLNRAMSKEPSSRYTRMADFVTDLRNVQAGSPLLAGTMLEAPAPDFGQTIVEPITTVPAAKAAPVQARTATTPATPTRGTAPAPAPNAPPVVKKDFPWALIGGGGALILLLLAGVILGPTLFGGGGDEATPTAIIVAGGDGEATTTVPVIAATNEPPTEAPPTNLPATEIAAPTEEATIAPTATDIPTSTNVPPTEELPTKIPATVTIPPLPTATNPPPPTATNPPPPTATNPPPTATQPPPQEFRAVIDAIGLNGNTYVVDYHTVGYQEQLPGMHVHFFFNTVPPAQAGSPGSGPWKVYGGPRPFQQYTVGDKPAAATQMCILVANPNHSIQMGSGNCWNLP